jgi:two-component system, NarL family, nitrate/nitrite response regulator NarL
MSNKLSKNETRVVELICSGLNNNDIAAEMRLSAKTIETHRMNIYRKCGARAKRQIKNGVQLYTFAMQHGLVQPPQQVTAEDSAG